MQNRFTGDIGDFGKYGLLRYVAKSGLRIGVNWYLTDDGEDSAGNLTDYLAEKYNGYLECDSELFKELYRIVYIQNARTVKRIEESNLLPPKTLFYSKILKANKAYREKWFQDSLKHLATCSLLFLDPDNNILLNDTGSRFDNEGIKYAFPLEIESYYSQGHSLIVYNHSNRQNEQDYFERFGFVKEQPSFINARFFLLRFNRQQVRYYLFVLQPRDSAAVEIYVDEMLKGSWGRKWKWKRPHFEKMEL
ncbi:MAG: hypothetical protein FNP40_15915 [Dehalobacter sp. 4CP]|uniref:hypothetical protein n=1 Tax=Dehalobacter sp. CP TaxID=2594474 RepID=UPI0013C86F0B|nr:hypothetical protein [Dehalobacter sp. 4CP]